MKVFYAYQNILWIWRILKNKMEELSLCSKCGCITKSIRVSRANWRCGKCKYNKTLSDIYFNEAIDRMKIQHFLLMKDKKMFYLCNQACGITKSKITNEYFKVTCKNCKRKLDKEKPKEDLF